MIGFRTDGDLKASGWIHLILLVPKKSICDAFYDEFATRPPFPCNPRKQVKQSSVILLVFHSIQYDFGKEAIINTIILGGFAHTRINNIMQSHEVVKSDICIQVSHVLGSHLEPLFPGFPVQQGLHWLQGKTLTTMLVGCSDIIDLLHPLLHDFSGKSHNKAVLVVT